MLGLNASEDAASDGFPGLSSQIGLLLKTIAASLERKLPHLVNV